MEVEDQRPLPVSSCDVCLISRSGYIKSSRPSIYLSGRRKEKGLLLAAGVEPEGRFDLVIVGGGSMPFMRSTVDWGLSELVWAVIMASDTLSCRL